MRTFEITKYENGFREVIKLDDKVIEHSDFEVIDKDETPYGYKTIAIHNYVDDGKDGFKEHSFAVALLDRYDKVVNFEMINAEEDYRIILIRKGKTYYYEETNEGQLEHVIENCDAQDAMDIMGIYLLYHYDKFKEMKVGETEIEEEET